MTKRVTYLCAECGSSDVLLDAWAEWDTECQDWVLHDTLTSHFCQRCDGEAAVLQVDLRGSDLAA